MDLDLNFPLLPDTNEEDNEDNEENNENNENDENDENEDEDEENNNLYDSLDMEIDDIGKSSFMNEKEEEESLVVDEEVEEVEEEEGEETGLTEDEKEENSISRIKETMFRKEEEREKEENEENEEDENENTYLQKIKSDLLRNEIISAHPETNFPSQKELKLLTTIIRNTKNQIIDENHQTLDLLSKYERTKIIGVRSTQIEAGAQPFVQVPEGIVIDGEMIAKMELHQKKSPFIICRHLGYGKCEYWNVNDLQNLED